MEEDCSCEVLLIAEAACGVLDPLDLGVDGFAGSVSDAVAEIGKDVLEASLQGPGYFQHGAADCVRPSRATSENVSARAARIGN